MRFITILLAMMVSTTVWGAKSTQKDQILRFASMSGWDLTQYPDALKEVEEHVAACGLGVIRGWDGKNSCSYQVEIDDYFLKPTSEKTGYLHDENWPYADGVQFMTASEEEMAAVPDRWDLSDWGPMVDIHKQNCGDCWSTSSRKLLEQALATHGVRSEEGNLVKLSAQTTLSSCCRWCGSCRGGYMTTPDFFSTKGSKARSYGLPTRDLDPYRGRNTSCKFNSSELKAFQHKLTRSPYVGSSLNYSRFFAAKDRLTPKIENTMALMQKYKSNALVTIKAINHSGGIISKCSAINSGGNHMQNIVGWYKNSKGQFIARIQNSWGRNHGQNGYTHLRWECGNNRLNRGVGKSTRVGILFDGKTKCKNMADAFTGPDAQFVKSGDGAGVILGRPAKVKQTCTWFPKDGIQEVLSEDGCQVRVNPSMTTEYHVIAKDSECSTTTSSMVLVTPTRKSGESVSGEKVMTPHGVAKM